MAAPKRVDEIFVDSFGVTIHYHRWSPRGKPRAIIQLAHGLGEHGLRYEGLVTRLVKEGFEVWANEHRGHGATGLEQWEGDYSKLGKLGPGGIPAAVAAVRAFTDIIRGERPGVPLYFLGHSGGAVVGQLILNQRGATLFDGVVFTGAAYRLPGFMELGDLNAKHKHLGSTGAEWLSRDVAVHEAWRDDPLTFPVNPLKLFGVLDAARFLGVPRRLDRDIPILLAIGSDCALGGEKSAKKLADALLRKGSSDVELIVYQGARHEIFNETSKDEVM
ncbi:MAG: alpha/beta hydrolase, partial [Pontimonas sp.]|nr:alpha/beta hydrolase [Pontimonas sp.]